MWLGGPISTDGEERRLDQTDGLPLARISLHGNRPGNDLGAAARRAVDRDRFHESNRNAGKVPSDNEHVARDPRQESMREPGNGELTSNLPAVAGFAQTMQNAIDPTDEELVSHAECRRREALELAAGEIGSDCPSFLRRVKDGNRLDDFSVLLQAADDVHLPLDRGDGECPALKRRRWKALPVSALAGEVEDQGVFKKLGVSGITAAHRPAADHVE